MFKKGEYLGGVFLGGVFLRESLEEGSILDENVYTKAGMFKGEFYFLTKYLILPDIFNHNDLTIRHHITLSFQFCNRKKTHSFEW